MAWYSNADKSVKGNSSGSPLGGPFKGVEETSIWDRLVSKSTWNGHCLLFTGSPSTKYGRTSVGKQKNLYVHRVVWALMNGPIPKGLDVCHSCDTPRCFWPSHLFIGSRSENMQDCKQKGRWNESSRGSAKMANGRAVLTDDQVDLLRLLRDEGWTYSALSNHFKIGETQVGRLVRKEQRV